MKKELPDRDILWSLLDYNPETGDLFWKERSIEHFGDVNGRVAENCQAVWNAKYAGTVAGCRRAYRIIKILGAGYCAHRIIWKMVHGEEPKEIDHIDRDKGNNRLANLRNVDHSTNMKNKPISKLNSTGTKHIHYCAKSNRFVVQLIVPGKGQRQVGRSTTLAGAKVIREDALREHGYDLVLEAA